jgi:hypothetical protein
MAVNGPNGPRDPRAHVACSKLSWRSRGPVAIKPLFGLALQLHPKDPIFRRKIFIAQKQLLVHGPCPCRKLKLGRTGGAVRQELAS